MEKGEKLALFLGMLSGDGCLSISHNGEGYRDYPIQFFNTEKEKVIIFQHLIKDLFNLEANICSRKKEERKLIWSIKKCSRTTVEYIKSLGFPEGVKRDVLRVLPIIKKEQKVRN